VDRVAEVEGYLGLGVAGFLGFEWGVGMVCGDGGEVLFGLFD